MSSSSSSVVVVEIDTRKGPICTVFESSVANQTEQAKQFWKTLSLAPHIESSLYSKEISQQIKQNTLKPMNIDNSKKPIKTDPKTDAFIKNVQVMIQVDDIMKIQKKMAKIESIRKLERKNRVRSKEVNGLARLALTNSESATNWPQSTTSSDDKISSNYINRIEHEYETNPDELNDVNEVKNLDFADELVPVDD